MSESSHEKLEKAAVKKAFPSKFAKFSKDEAKENKTEKKMSGKSPKK